MKMSKVFQKSDSLGFQIQTILQNKGPSINSLDLSKTLPMEKQPVTTLHIQLNI